MAEVRPHRSTVAFFCMPFGGHFRRCRALIQALTDGGIDVVVFGDVTFGAEAREAGARFVDLFEGRPLAAVDDSSYPRPCRFVSFAGQFADAVIDEVRSLRPQLVIADSYAVIARVVSEALHLPLVSVCAGHNEQRASWLPRMSADPDLRVSDACLRAVDRLRDDHGLADASPFSFIAPPSPDLNIYCEPPQFLTAAERPAFEPVVFFGSLPSRPPVADGDPESDGAFPSEAPVKVYVSFGTALWFYHPAPEEALAALRSIVSAIAVDPTMCGLVSLGGWGLDPGDLSDLEGPSVRVERYVDQWRVLSQADVFVTHHGLNSTHEAIFHGVPMVSYPFFADQPDLAARCQELDLAVPLGSSVRAPIDADHVHAALHPLPAERSRLAAGLAAARVWEEDVIAQRGTVLRRISQLLE